MKTEELNKVLDIKVNVILTNKTTEITLVANPSVAFTLDEQGLNFLTHHLSNARKALQTQGEKK